MDNSVPKVKEKLPPDKSTSVQKLLNNNCFCDELSISSNHFPCSSCAVFYNLNNCNESRNASLIGPQDSQPTNAFYDGRNSNITQNESPDTMNFQSSPSFCQKDDSRFTQDTGNIKRKRPNDIEVDLSKFSTQGKHIDSPSVNTQNRFSILGELEIEEEHNILKNTNKKSAPVKDNGFCPPIFLFNVNIKHLIEQLNEKKVTFKIVNKNKHKSKLYLKDAAAHSDMMNILRDKKIESYSYTPKELKRTSIILRGLYYKTDLADIKREIDSLVPNTVDNITKFSTNYTRKNNLETSLFLVTLCSGKKHNEITGLRYLLNQRVYWESPRANLKEVQCWRCQKWGHMSRNCNRPFRCVKCDESHVPGVCKFVSSPENLPFCVNCNERGHPSNFKGCSEYKRYIKMKDALKNSAKDKQKMVFNNVASAINASSFVQKGKSFASLLQKVVPNQSVSPKKMPSYIQEFIKIAQSFCQPEPLTLKKKLRGS